VSDISQDWLYKDEFDLVVSFNALHWIPQQGEALRAITCWR
jgi:hypothetical protein